MLKYHKILDNYQKQSFWQIHHQNAYNNRINLLKYKKLEVV